MEANIDNQSELLSFKWGQLSRRSHNTHRESLVGIKYLQDFATYWASYIFNLLIEKLFAANLKHSFFAPLTNV
jgi:hypothetical protein